MKSVFPLHWVSPLPPAKSGIADYTASLLPHLAGLADVTLWTDQSEWDKDLERWARVRRLEFEPGPPAELLPTETGAPVPIVNFGNSPLHYGCWQVARAVPHIAVVHDVCLQDFFRYAFIAVEKDEGRYFDAMGTAYGLTGREAGRQCLRGMRAMADVSMEYPLGAFACKSAMAAVVHSEWSRRWLAKDGFAPAVHLPFPYPSRVREVVPPREEPFRIVLCGYFNTNRRLDSFLKAFATFPERRRFRIEIYGTIWDPPYIESILDETDIRRQVALHGFQPTLELDRRLSGAALAVNLRYPTMGEASMSQLQLWDSGIPTMATPVGWYAELPPETILPVHIDREEADIHRHLAAFLADRKTVSEVGRRGKALLESRHDPDSYAVRIFDLASSWRRLSAQRVAGITASRAAAASAGWMSETAFPRWSRRIAETIAGTYGREGK